MILHIELPAAYGFIHIPGYGEQAFLSELSEEPYISHRVDPGARLEFMFSASLKGTFEVFITGAALKNTSFTLEIESASLSADFEETGAPLEFVERSLGTLSFDFPGQQGIAIRPDENNWTEMNLKRIRLRRK